MFDTLLQYYQNWPILFKAITLLVGILFTSSVVAIYVIYTSRKRKNKADIRKNELTMHLAEKLIPHFYDDESVLEENCIKFYNEHVNSNESKELVLGILMEQNQNFKGDAKEKTNKIYEWLHLHEYSLSKLESKDWSVVCQGLTELSTFVYLPSAMLVAKHISHPDKTVKKIALQSFLSLQPDGSLPKEHIINLDREISIWEQIMIFHKMYEMGLQHECHVMDFVNSHKSIFAFALKVNCIESVGFTCDTKLVEAILNMNDEHAVILFIDWLKKFNLSDHITKLFNERHRFSNKVQHHIIQAAESIPNLELALYQITSDQSPYLATSAAKALLSMNIVKYDDQNSPAFNAAKNPLVHV